MYCSNKVKVIKIVKDPTQVGDPGLESPRNGHNIESHINNKSNDPPMQSFLIPVVILVDLLYSTNVIRLTRNRKVRCSRCLNKSVLKLWCQLPMYILDLLHLHIY